MLFQHICLLVFYVAKCIAHTNIAYNTYSTKPFGNKIDLCRNGIQTHPRKHFTMVLRAELVRELRRQWTGAKWVRCLPVLATKARSGQIRLQGARGWSDMAWWSPFHQTFGQSNQTDSLFVNGLLLSAGWMPAKSVLRCAKSICTSIIGFWVCQSSRFQLPLLMMMMMMLMMM